MGERNDNDNIALDIHNIVISRWVWKVWWLNTPHTVCVHKSLRPFVHSDYVFSFINMKLAVVAVVAAVRLEELDAFICQRTSNVQL